MTVYARGLNLAATSLDRAMMLHLHNGNPDPAGTNANVTGTGYSSQTVTADNLTVSGGTITLTPDIDFGDPGDRGER